MVKEKNKNNKLKWFLWITIPTIIILILIGASVWIVVPYNAYEIEYESVPYEERVCNNLNLKYAIEWGDTTTRCLSEICDEHRQYCIEKNFWGNCIEYGETCVHSVCTLYKRYCEVKIKNVDDEAGTWGINVYSNIEGSKKFITTKNQYIQPTKEKTFYWEFKYNPQEDVYCDYDINKIPQKRICEDKIKYKEVGKAKNIIKYCNLWKKIIGRCKDEEKPFIPVVA